MNNSNNGRLPRVLVSTVSGWSNSIGEDTMSTLFSKYDCDKLAALYIRAEMSDSPVCKHYFHIIEHRVIKSILNSKVKTGEEYYLSDERACDNKSKESSQEKKFYSKFKSFRPWGLIILREVLWKYGHWKSEELDSFLEGFSPEVLFFPIESYIHFNSINEYIIEKCKPKMVVCTLWDDNFTYKQSKRIGYRIHRYLLRKQVTRIVNKGSTFIVQNPKMQREFKEEFGKESILITKPIFTLKESELKHPSLPLKMVYTGSLYINRDKTVMAVVEALKTININKIRISLDIYSGSFLPNSEAFKINKVAGCHFYGRIPQDEVFKKQQTADVLLFVEDLSDKNLAARLSFSTKLTDYLGAQKCILAIGNSDLAPIEYLKENDAAIVCTKVTDILPALNSLLSDDEIVLRYARNAYYCGKTKHNGDEILGKLYDLLSEYNTL